MLQDILINLSIVSSGLFCGLIMTLVFILQKQWVLLDDETYKNTFRLFLKVAKNHWLITIFTLYSFIVPITIGLMNTQTVNGLMYLIAGIIFFIGCILVTVKFNFTLYDRVMNHSNDKLKDVSEIKQRFYVLNIVRFSSSLLTFLILTYWS